MEQRHLSLIGSISVFDIIFTQEMIDQSWEMIQSNLPNYHHFTGKTEGWVNSINLILST